MAIRPTIVTGAAGFAGGHLLDRLADRGPLVGWHRPGGMPPQHAPGTVWEAVDLLDAVAVRQVVASRRPARIYQLAGMSHIGASWRSSLEPLRVHVLGTHHLLDAVRRAAPDCRVLVVSSATIYRPGDRPIDEATPFGPSSPYALSKLGQDQLALETVRTDGMDVAIARPFNHAGPRQNPLFAISSFARQIAAIERGGVPPEIHVGNLEARRDLTDVRDTVEAYERIMDAAPSGRPFNVCSGVSYRIGDLLDRLIARSSTPVRVVEDADRMRPIDIPVLTGDGSRLRSELGWTPSRSIDTLLTDALDWWRQELRGTDRIAAQG